MGKDDFRQSIFQLQLRQFFAGEGVPEGGEERAVGVLDLDHVDREEDLLGAADFKFGAEGALGELFDLVAGVSFGEVRRPMLA